MARRPARTDLSPTPCPNAPTGLRDPTPFLAVEDAIVSRCHAQPSLSHHSPAVMMQSGTRCSSGESRPLS
jgi:hypothetical protein